jgi:hypothetical protein
LKINDLIEKTCLIGLSYFDTSNNLLKQVQYSGKVQSADEKEGIAIALHQTLSSENVELSNQFILPPELSAWFIAPAGDYKNINNNIDIKNPDYFVTWDIFKKKEDATEGDHEWWDWKPRVAAPQVN